MLLLESDGDDGKEEEGKEPGEGDPETEEEHDGLGDEHLDSLDGRVVEHFLDAGGLELGAGHVALVTGRFAEGLGTLAQSDTATGLTEEEDDDDGERDVGQTLNTFNPAPADGLVDESSVDGGSDSTQDSDVGERGHGDGTAVGLVHVTEGTTDQDGTDTSEETQQGTADDDSGNVLAQRETDEHESEADVSTNVDNLTTNQLTEGGQEHRSDGAGEVEGEQSQLAQLFRDTEFLTHSRDTGTVCCCCKTDEEGHETEQQTQESLLLAAPVERVFEIAGSEVEDNDLVVIVVGCFGEGQGHVNVDLLQSTVFGEGRLVIVNLLGIFPSDDTSNLSFLLRGGICRCVFCMGRQLRLLGLIFQIHLD